MGEFQMWLEQMLASVGPIRSLMRNSSAWPIVESVHFIGLTLLFGSIAAWDLRLLGMAKRVPIVAFHRLVPVAVLGFAINATTGFMFLTGFPDQYVYNRAFHFKLLFLALAGLNVLLFYVTTFRRLAAGAAGDADPLSARVAGAVSLTCWTAVIFWGRMITFYRPNPCLRDEAMALLVQCLDLTTR
jgi:hypothetical protein